jgi:Tol biopolymer transport system component
MVRRMPLALLLVLLLAAGCSATSAAPTPQAASPSPSTNSGLSPIAAAKGWLAYQSVSPRGPDGVFLVRADGSDDHEILTDLPGPRLHPDFSRDGNRLAFDSEVNVYVADADGTGPRLIANCDPNAGCMQHWEPAWSPDGTQLAISTAAGMGDPPKRFGIAIVDVATQTVRPVVDHASRAGQDHFPRWSPDGRRLVFWRARYGPGGSVKTAVFVVNVNGTGLRQLTPWSLLAGDPDWSPDGSLIVFNTRPLVDFPDAGQSELYTIRPDGSGLRRLTAYGPTGPRATQPRWTPDGKAILYTRTTQTGSPRHIYAINADGTADVPVLTAKPIYTHPILQPTP